MQALHPLGGRAKALDDAARDFAAGDGKAFCDVPEWLAAMGPWHVAFGRYLGTRIDLLPFGYCQELFAIRDWTEPMDPALVSNLFAAETGIVPERAFLHFDAQPFESRACWQSHRAKLGHAPVIVRIFRFAQGESAAAKLPLRSLSPNFATFGLPATAFHSAVDAFLSEIETINSASEQGAACSLTRDAQLSPVLAERRIYSHLCTRRILVFEGGQPLHFDAGFQAETARTLCIAWLRQVLAGSVYPLEPAAENIAIESNGRMLFTGGPFASFPEKVKWHLSEYLNAVATQNADEAYEHLLRANVLEGAAADDDEFKRRLRQASLFRDGLRGSDPNARFRTAYPRFSEEVLIHWQLARHRGEISPHLTQFFRGFHGMVRTAEALAPGRDWTLEALYDLRLLHLFDQAKDFVRPTELAEIVENFATGFLALPEQLDRWLTLAGSGKTRRGSGSEGAGRRSVGGYLTSTGIVLAFVGSAVLLHDVEAASQSAAVKVVSALVFVVVSALVIRMANRL